MLNKFDLCKSPLAGRWLLEASAGTGKTYSLEHLVLRLLVEENVAVNRVLLVTFTNAATNEIKERVGALLRRMLARVENPEKGALSDALEETLIAGWNKSSGELADIFTKAIEDLEDASILTIHKFCQKMLSELSFTRGGDFGQSFSQDTANVELVVEDFIRKESVSLLPEDAMKLVDCRDTLVELLNEKLTLARPVVENMRCSVDEEKGLVSPAVAAVFERFLHEAPERLAALEHRNRTTTFSGLLVQTYELVKSQPALAALIRERYEALLIDEFQDTDSIQYGIFKTIFFPDDPNVRPPKSIFFVGDPKQAIYAFRMAELETYIEARREIEALPAGAGGVLSLATNFRSARPLVMFVNAFFAQKTQEALNGSDAGAAAQKSAFLSPNILYEDIAAGGSAMPLVREENGVLHPVPAVSLWLHDDSCDIWETAKEKPVSADDVRSLEAEWIARDIAGLLKEKIYIKKKTVVAGRLKRSRRLRAGDIVILVPGRKTAGIYVAALASRGIRSAVASNDDVLKTDEAVEILGVLRAMLSVQSRTTVNAARATRLFGRSLRDLRERDDLGVADRGLLEEALSRWTTSGPAGALGLVIERRETVRRLLGVKQGRSALQNYAHVIEILQRQFNALRGAVSVVKWLETQMVAVGSCPEERVVQAVAGDDVVRILTMHSSKGLEFPVVYLAMTSSLKEQKRAVAFFKGTEDGVPFAVASPTQIAAQYQELADQREREEKVRLAYVAMTRASSRLVLPLFWSVNKQWRASFDHAYNRALFAADGEHVAQTYDAICPQLRAVCRGLQEQVGKASGDCAPDPADFGENLTLSDEFGRPESLVEIRTEAPDEARLSAVDEPVECRALPSEGLAQSWRRSSFTAMARRLMHEGRGAREDYEPGTDALDQMEAAAHEASAAVASTASLGVLLDAAGVADTANAAGVLVHTPKRPNTLHDLPGSAAQFLRGAGVGDWLHRQLQRAFNAGTKDERRESLLSAHERLQQAYFMMNRTDDEMRCAEELVSERFAALSSAPILKTKEGEVVSIADIDPARCVPEMQFLLHAPSGSLSIDRLVAQLKAVGLSFETDSHEALCGYVTGSIDLMFEAAGKYWIIDWKSNFLGDGLPASYTQQAMEDEIKAKNYALQYTIYLVALKRHLLATTALTRETVWNAIGGAAYVFLRGIEAGAALDAAGRRNGVYFTCPREAVDALDRLLMRTDAAAGLGLESA